jgi:hypothetical protein
VAAALLARIRADLCQRYDLPEASHALLMKVQTCQRHALTGMMKKHRQDDSYRMSSIGA